MTMEPKTILLVEDNPDDEILALRAFRKNNLLGRIVVVRDGVEALDYVLGADHQSRPMPHLIILDIKLPKIDGLEVLRRLRAERRTAMIPIVILTSSKEEQDLLAGYGLGANSYIRKPVDFPAFSEAARLLGMYWLGLNELPRATAEG
jgi:two-component system, response regulator